MISIGSCFPTLLHCISETCLTNMDVQFCFLILPDFSLQRLPSALKSYPAYHQNLLLINFQFVGTLLCLQYGTKPRKKSDLPCVNHSFPTKPYLLKTLLIFSFIQHKPLYFYSLYIKFSMLLDTFYYYYFTLSVYDVNFQAKGYEFSNVFKARGYH